MDCRALLPSQLPHTTKFVRDYLESIRWNKQPPVPSLPEDVVTRTREKYLDAFRLITGRTDLANP